MESLISDFVQFFSLFAKFFSFERKTGNQGIPALNVENN